MKVMVIHNADAAGKALAHRVAAIGFDVTEQPAVWPDYFNAIHLPFTLGMYRRPDTEQHEIIIVEGSFDPSAAREIAGYLGETAFTRHLPLYLVGHPEDQLHKAKRRAPIAHIVSPGQLDNILSEKAPVADGTNANAG